LAVDPESLLVHADFVRTLARRLVRDDHRADDVVQETWLAALRNPPHSLGAVRSWLSSVTLNWVRTEHRNDTRRVQRETASAQQEEMEAFERAQEREAVRQQVVKAVLSLPEPYRGVILLRFYDDLAPREIAARLGRPVETVKTHIKRGLARLRADLDTRYGGNGRDWLFALAPVAGLKTLPAVCTTAGIGPSLTGLILMITKMKAVTIALMGVALVFMSVIWIKGCDPHPADRENGSLAESLAGGEMPGDGPRPDVTSVDGLGTGPSSKLGSRIPIPESSLTVRGRILTQNGKPIEGVVIQQARFASEYGYRLPDDLPWENTGCRTGSDGGFNLAVPENALRQTALRFSGPGYCSLSVPLSAALQGPDHDFLLDDIRLLPALYISGRVVDLKGEPVPRCELTAPGKPWETEWYRVHDRVRSDGAGKFRMHVQRQNPIRITALHPDLGMGWSEEFTPCEGREITGVKIKLQKTDILTGRIQKADASPASEILVYAQGARGNYTIKRQTLTDNEGRFRFPLLPVMPYRLYIDRVGGPEVFSIDPDRDIHVLSETVVPDGKDRRYRLPSGSKVYVKIEDLEGNPIDIEPEIEFWQYSEEYFDDEQLEYKYNWSGTVEHPEPGIFGFDRILPGTYTFDLDIKGHSSFYSDEFQVPPAPETATVPVTAEPLGRIKGCVFLADGEPCAGMEVLLESISSLRKMGERTVLEFTSEGIRQRPDTREGYESIRITDENGFFDFTAVDLGRYRLVLARSGIEVFEKSPVRIMAQKPFQSVIVNLPPITGRIEGRVSDGSKNTLAGALVVAWDGENLISRARADADGRYCFNGLPDGRYIVDARANTSSSSLFKYYQGSDSEYSNIREGCKNLERMNPFNAVLQGGGSVILDLILADPWNAVIHGSINAGAEFIPNNVDIRIEDTGWEVHGDEWLTSTIADLFHRNINKSCRDQDERGTHFRFDDLMAGRYYLELSWRLPGLGFEWSIFHTEPFKLETSQYLHLDIHLPLCGIEGIVLAKTTREPIPDAQVSLRLDRGKSDVHIRCTTREDGSFSLQSIPADSYDFVISHPDFCPLGKQDWVLLENRNHDGLCFLLEPGCSLDVRLEKGGQIYSGALYVYADLENLGMAFYQPGDFVCENGTIHIAGLPCKKIKIVVDYYCDPIAEAWVDLPLPEGECLVIEVP